LRPRPGSIAAPTGRAAIMETMSPTRKLSPLREEHIREAVTMATLGPMQTCLLAVMVIAICTAKATLRRTYLTLYHHCLAAATGHNREELFNINHICELDNLCQTFLSLWSRSRVIHQTLARKTHLSFFDTMLLQPCNFAFVVTTDDMFTYMLLEDLNRGEPKI
jgi:hypothetical protein